MAILPLTKPSASTKIHLAISQYQSLLNANGWYMSISSDRNIGEFLKLHRSNRGTKSLLEIWLQPCVDTVSKETGFISYKNFIQYRSFPTLSLLRDGYPQYKVSNDQYVIRHALNALFISGLWEEIYDWQDLAHANEYRRQMPEFDPAALVLRQRIYPN